MSVNAILIWDGVITQEPNYKVTASGKPVLTLNVGTSRRWKDREGNQQEDKAYFEIRVWGPAADKAAEKARRLGHVFCRGVMKMETWEDKETREKRSKYVIQPEWPEWDSLFIYPPEERQASGGGHRSQPPQGKREPPRRGGVSWDSEYEGNDPSDDDIPF